MTPDFRTALNAIKRRMANRQPIPYPVARVYFRHMAMVLPRLSNPLNAILTTAVADIADSKKPIRRRCGVCNSELSVYKGISLLSEGPPALWACSIKCRNAYDRTQHRIDSRRTKP